MISVVLICFISRIIEFSAKNIHNFHPTKPISFSWPDKQIIDKLKTNNDRPGLDIAKSTQARKPAIKGFLFHYLSKQSCI
jgi:hypothetical protein